MLDLDNLVRVIIGPENFARASARQLRDNRLELLRDVLQPASYLLVENGLISEDEGASMREECALRVDAEVIEASEVSPEDRLKNHDKTMREIAAYERPDENSDQASARREQAFKKGVAIALSGNTPQRYYELASTLAPERVTEVRRKLDLDQPAEPKDDEPFDLDAGPRELSDDEQEMVARGVLHEITGNSLGEVDRGGSDEPEHAGDWSPDAMQRFMERRSKEEGA
jgi:hypothetical protein